MVRFFYVKYTKNVKFLSDSRSPNGPDLPSPSARKFQFSLTPCLMMGDVPLETSPKNIMIQDMINSENSILFHFTLILLKLQHALITTDLLNQNPTKKVMLLY